MRGIAGELKFSGAVAPGLESSANSAADGASGQLAFRSGHSNSGLQSSPTVRIARTLPELEDLKEPWSLWCDDPGAELDFYLASARCRPDFVRPHVMVVYREGKPDCMLVGRLERGPLKLKVGYSTLFEPRVSRLFFLQGGFFGNCSEENTQLLVRELRRCLERGEAHCAELNRVTQDSSLQRATREEFGSLRRGHFSPLHEHHWLELSGSFEEFLQGMSRKNRHEFRRHEKKLAQDFAGKTHIRCYRHEEEVNELARDVEKVAGKTYQRALGVGFQSNAETQESLRTAARKGSLRAWVLYLDRQPCAFFVGKQSKDTLHGNFMGFDAQFGKYSPGLLVLMHGIQECFDPSLRASRVDLGWGDRQYKRVICNRTRKDGPICLYSLSPAGLALNCLGSATWLLDRLARKLLAESSLLQKFKRAWQDRLQRSKPSDRSHKVKRSNEIMLKGQPLC